MARKKKSKRRAERSAIAPWLILSVALAVIGFACTRSPQRVHTHAHTVAQVTPPIVTPEPAVTAAPAVTSAPAQTAPPAQTPAPAQTAAPAVTSVPAQTPSPLPGAAGTHRLALIIDDCGQWPETERGFIALPVALTLSVLPDVRYNHAIAQEAIAADKGVMLHLPMETLSGLNPGPGKITTEMSDAAITAMVEHDLSDVDLAQGVNNHEGSRATADPRVMNDVMAVLARRDEFFIDSKTNSKSVAERIASEHGVANAGRDVFLDNRADVASTEAQLQQAADIAERDGSAIAIGHPKPTTLAAVRAMLPRLEAAGITFVLAKNLTQGAR